MIRHWTRFFPAALLAMLLLRPAAVGAGTVCTTAGKASLRSGPGAAFRVTWEVPRHMPLVESARDGAWIKVRDVDGDIHWVAEGAVTKTVRCAVVKAEKTALRKDPGAKAAVLQNAARYESFRVLGEKGSWLQVDLDGKAAWMAAADVWSG